MTAQRIVVPAVFLVSLALTACNSGGPSSGSSLAVEASILDFGDVLIGSSRRLEVTVSNREGSWLQIDSFALSDNTSDNFVITSGYENITLVPDASLTCEIEYSPDSEGVDFGTLIVTVLDGDGAAISLLGNGVSVPAAEIEATPSLDFGNVVVGSSKTLQVSVENIGSSVLEVSDVRFESGTSTDFAATRTLPRGSIAPGANISFDVRYTPGSVGGDTGGIVIESDDSDEPRVLVPLSGTGVEVPVPEIEVTPLSLDFAGVLVGDSVTQSVRIRNLGDVNLNVSDIALGSGVTSEFSILSVPGTLGLVPGSHFLVEVTYAPVDNVPDSGTLRIFSDDPDEFLTVVSLSGSGAQVPLPDIQVSPRALDFGSILTGGTKSLDVTVQNAGSARLSVTSASLSTGTSPEFTLISSRSFDLQPGSGRTLTVTYAPNDEISDSGLLRLESNDADDPVVTVSLSGNAVPLPEPEIDTSRTSMAFGTVLVGESREVRLTITNSGTDTLVLNSVRLGTGTGPSFTITSRPADGTAISAGNSRNVDVSYAPAEPGAETGTLRISSNDSDESLLVVPLSGNASPLPEPEIATDRPSMPFGTVLVGDSRSLSVIISNIGEASLTVDTVRLGSGTDPDFTITRSPEDGAVIPPGGSRSVDVSFAPGISGAQSGTLRIASDDADEPVVVVPLSGTGEAVSLPPSLTLAWDAPTRDEDGNPLSGLSGYRLYVGESPQTYTQVFEVGNVTTYTLDTLSSGTTYYIAVTARSSAGESEHSQEIVVSLP